MVEELIPSDGSVVGLAESVMEATCADEPIVTFVVCVTPPDSHLISAIPGVVPAISDTTTLPGTAVVLCDVTVMVCLLFEKWPSFVVNVTGTLDRLIRLPDVSKSSAVMVDELSPTGSEVGLADSLMEATCPDVPIVTTVDCVTFPDSHTMVAIPELLSSIVCPAISDTSTFPDTPKVPIVATVMVWSPLEKRPIGGLPSIGLIVNLTKILSLISRLPDISSKVAVRVDELTPSAGSEVGFADSVIDATSADEPIVTFVDCVTPPDSQTTSATPGVFSAISDTTTLPNQVILVNTVMVLDPLEK